MDPITNITELLEAINEYYVTPASSKITGDETNAVLHAMIRLLPPSEVTLTDEEIHDYLMSLPGYGPGKMLASDFTWIAYDDSLPQLSAVRGFTLGGIGAHSINISWEPVGNADGYILQRDMTDQFANPLTIYSGSSDNFSATGLLLSTTYFFRIKAIALNYQDSAFVVGLATTSNINPPP